MALPAAVFGLACLTLVAAAGYAVAHFEHRMSQAHAASVAAFYTADGGLREYLASRNSPAPAPVAMRVGGLEASVQALPLIEVDGRHRLVHLVSRAAAPVPGGGRAGRAVAAVALFTEPPDIPPVEAPGSWYEVMDLNHPP